MAESQRDKHRRRLQRLRDTRMPWEDTWRELDQFLTPGYLRFSDTLTHNDRGDVRRLNIIDTAGQEAHRVFSSGLQSGVTSQARPWMRLVTSSKGLREVNDVKIYLDQTTQRMREVMSKSNFYDTFHTKYGALGSIGTAVSYISPDPKYIVRNNYVMAGQYWIATNAIGFIDTLYHIIPMTTQQIIGAFQRPGDNVPRVVREAYDRGDRDQAFNVYHAMEPRTHRDKDSSAKRDMPYLSNYWMDEEDGHDTLLRESGSAINRIIGSRWNVIGDDPYGYSLGMNVLADVKQLQHIQTRKLEILDKTTQPPMIAPTSLRGKRSSLLPGAITYSDDAHQRGGFRPALDLSNYNLGPLTAEIRDTQERISTMFYRDLFLAVTSMPGVQPRNQFEIAGRKEEQMLQLGPALDRLHTEELEPTIAAIYHYMGEAGILPPLPQELEASPGELTVEYVSTMAQAQRAVGVGAIERTAGFVGNLAATNPEALDKFNADQAVDEYADRVGLSAAIVRSDEEVAAIREQRAQAQAQAEAAQNAATVAPALNQAAQGAKVLSEIGAGQPGDPSRLLDQVGIGR